MANAIDIWFVITIGPGETELALDTLASIRTFYPECGIWVRDDCTTDGTWEALLHFAQSHPTHVRLQRNSVARGYYGRASLPANLPASRAVCLDLVRTPLPQSVEGILQRQLQSFTRSKQPMTPCANTNS